MSYFITQPVYSKEKIIEIYHATKHLNKPFFIGIMPIASYKRTFCIMKCQESRCQMKFYNNLKQLKMYKAKTRELSLKLSAHQSIPFMNILMVYTLSHRFNA
ncbi:hypothetical protein ACVNPX_08525 [Staphylococcus aureus]